MTLLPGSFAVLRGGAYPRQKRANVAPSVAKIIRYVDDAGSGRPMIVVRKFRHPFYMSRSTILAKPFRVELTDVVREATPREIEMKVPS